MPLFTKHPRTKNETWWEHCKFAVGVGYRLLVSSILFIIHGLLPFIPIPNKFNLDNMSEWLDTQSTYR